jgi:hypothetical protein
MARAGAADEAPRTSGRRGFLLTLGGIGAAWVGALLWPVYRYVAPLPEADPFGSEGRLRIDKLEAADLARPGSGGNGGYAGRGIIVLRGKDGA